jgi:hypothetical protein
MMNNDKMVKAWQQKILDDCERILQRRLSDAEVSFVSGREGFMALEMIQDSVSGMNAHDLLAYLNSEGDCWRPEPDV